MKPDCLWRPSPDCVRQSNMTAFSRFVSENTGKTLSDYAALHAWSTQNLLSFWQHFAEFTDLVSGGNCDKILEDNKMPGAEWCRGMELNYAENLLGRDFAGIAIRLFIESDSGQPNAAYQQEVTFSELRELVARCAHALRNIGIKSGDRVAGYIANVPEAIVACLACASIGAVWSSASPDFGLDALTDRFEQVAPRLVFASTHYRYGGKTFDTAQVVAGLKQRIPSIECIVSVPYPIGESEAVGDVLWTEFLGEKTTYPLEFNRLPFAHPLFILFSSGTTGAPKCMVHGAGGTLLQHRKEQQLHCDIKSGDAMLFFTTCGWMMWNWQLSVLSLGATVCLYDGSPGYPDLSSIWRVVDQWQVTHFGTSGRFIESCMKQQPVLKPGGFAAFNKLRSVQYTGSPLSPDGFRWIYEHVKSDIHLAGISGGTDIVSCFILGNPNLPVHAGEIQCKGLGVDVAALNEAGEAVVGEPGELVCRQPIPSMPVAFLNDDDGAKYHKAYFDVYPGLWCHGDFVEFTPAGGAVVYGRSDATLNPGGVRIGSAEIYSALDVVEGITDSVVVGWVPPAEADEVIVLFVVLADGTRLDESFKRRMRQTIRRKFSPRHVPKHIFQISEVPVTRSGKTVELSVKAILAGRAISNHSALANPQILESFDQVRRDLLLLYS